jgi:hypothetical protein
VKKDVTTVRAEVSEYLDDWAKVRDVMGGERKVKAARTRYLPKPNPSDKSEENNTRYDQYVDRAVFFSATKRTLDGMIGIAFRRWPEVALPTKVQGFQDDIDGSGGGLVNQVRRSLEENLSVGRGGLLVDYPNRETAVSVAEERSGNIHPTLTQYRAEQIINWRRNDRGQLSLVVLHEIVEESDDYAVNAVEQWRELALGNLADDGEGESATYVMKLWRKNDKKEVYLYQEFRPLDSSGRPWQEIPFQFYGAVDNDPDIDQSPLYPLACLNIAHYRNSADYEESVYFNGQPTVALGGLTQTWVTEVLKDQVFLGSRSAIPLPEGGTISLVQAGPNTLAGEALKRKEEQMIAMGARLLTPGEAVKTAEQSRSETAAAHSVLSLACDNISNAYQQALKWVCRFSGDSDASVEFSIDTDFVGLIADPQLAEAIMKLWQGAAIPVSEKNRLFRIIGLIDAEKTDEDIAEEIDAEGGGLDLSDDLNAQDLADDEEELENAGAGAE